MTNYYLGGRWRLPTSYRLGGHWCLPSGKALTDAQIEQQRRALRTTSPAPRPSTARPTWPRGAWLTPTRQLNVVIDGVRETLAPGKHFIKADHPLVREHGLNAWRDATVQRRRITGAPPPGTRAPAVGQPRTTMQVRGGSTS